MDINEAKEIFTQLYETVSGSTISLAGREAHQYKSKSFVYGEVLFDTFYKIIKEIDPKPGEIFYDLGSGTGKAVFIAHLAFHFSKAIGIEYVDSLYEASMNVLKKYETEIKPKIQQKVGSKEIEFILGDMLEIDFTNADIIFMNSTCFQDDLFAPLEKKLLHVKNGTRIITLTKPLTLTPFILQKQEKSDFSWGQATVFYYRKQDSVSTRKIEIIRTSPQPNQPNQNR